MAEEFSHPSNGRARIMPVSFFIVIAVVAIGVMLALWATRSEQSSEQIEANSQQQASEPASAPPVSQAPSPNQTPEPVCRIDSTFVGGFMSPSNNDEDTRALLQEMKTDAITFGGWVNPVDNDAFPEEVQAEIGDRNVYEYTVDMNWDDTNIAGTETEIEVDDALFTLVEATPDDVVVTTSPNNADPFHSLTRSSHDLETQAFIGLPLPQMRTEGSTWLPDNSYAEVVDSFSTKFVEAHDSRGADGYYLALEMPLTDTDHWSPVTDYYQRQIDIVESVSPSSTVIISPYLEAREDSAVISPDTAAAGYEKFLGLSNGLNILVSPQDGLGVGTTALESDHSDEHDYTTEEYFQALERVDAESLYVTVEAMQPGGGSSDSREPTTRKRIEEQVEATAPYVQGAIAYQWSGTNAMTEIPEIGAGGCAAGPGLL